VLNQTAALGIDPSNELFPQVWAVSCLKSIEGKRTEQPDTPLQKEVFA
jgi:hypothetical protein